MLLKWGIASAGFISNDFVAAVSTLPNNEHHVVAVAARNQEKANAFAKLHDIPKAYEGYEKLAKDSNVDAVYIGSVNTTHFELGMMMLDHGKHVLCEKPLCLNEKQSAKLLNHAKSKKLFFMEAVWSRFFPSYQYLKKQIDAGVLGEIREVDVSFGFFLKNIDRMRMRSLGGGTVLDLGIYTIQVSQWVFREPPKAITATGQLNEDGIDLAMTGELRYSNGIAKIKTSALGLEKNKAIITGTKGKIILHDFWCATSLTDVDGTVKEWPLPRAKNKFNFPNACGLRYEAQETRKCIMAGLLESSDMNHNESLIIARIEDEIRRQIGVRYDEDDL